MVQIVWNNDKKRLDVSFNGEAFPDLVESAKHSGLKYDPKAKKWHGEAVKLNDYIEEFQLYDKIEIDEYTKVCVDEYRESLYELKIISQRNARLKFIPELMKKPPLMDKKSDGEHIETTFQYKDITWAINRNRSVSNLDCGLGKSYILAGILAHLRHYSLARKCLIFSSNIGLYNLKQEIIKFIHIVPEEIFVCGSVGELDEFHGRDVFNTDKYPYSIIIMGYDIYRNISDFYDKNFRISSLSRKKREEYEKGALKLKKIEYTKSHVPIKEWLEGSPGIVMFDECHFIGGHSSLRTKSIEMIIKNFEYRHFFTATFSASWERLYAPLNIIDKGLVDGLGYYEWLSQYVELGGKYGKYDIQQDTWKLDKLDSLNQKLYSRYAVKRKRSDYLNLPPLIHEPPIMIEWSASHREIYEAFSYWLSDDIKTQNNTNHLGLVANAINSFSFAILAVENPEILKDSKHFNEFPTALQKLINNFNFNRHHRKVQALDAVLMDHCDELGQKVIVYYFHPKTLESLKVHLKKYKPYIISSEVKKEDRLGIAESFKKDADSKVILLSVGAASTSITLTEAKAIIWFETGWDGIAYDQGNGRIQRPGQEDVTKIWDLRMKNSFDTLQYFNLLQKGDLINKLLSKQFFNEDQWKALFNFNEESLSLFI
jgi:SNF2 family DNA or RNA helicase